MAYIPLRANFELVPGDGLKCDCPGWDSHESKRFHENYNGKSATFVGYATHVIGPLDPRGRLPGLYADIHHIMVKFDGETDPKKVDVGFFSLNHPRSHKVLPAGFDFEAQRVGNLPFALLYYPGDTVRVVRVEHPDYNPWLNKEGKVGGMTDKGSYFVDFGDVQNLHFNPQGLEMVARGNVNYLYTDPSGMRFDLDEQEVKFWAHEGIMRALPTGDSEYLKLATDLLYATSSPKFYRALRLHDCFARHRDHVRSLNQRMLKKGLTEFV